MRSSKNSRSIDEFGRISLPVEMRRAMELGPHDPVSIECDGEIITVRKINHSCIFCGNPDDLTEMSGKYVCKDCINLLTQK